MGISDNDMPIKGDRIDGKHGVYMLGEEVGRGGNGIVFSARIVNRKDDILREGQEVVVKILALSSVRNTREKEKRRERFQREVKAVQQVSNTDLDILPIRKGVRYEKSVFW